MGQYYYIVNLDKEQYLHPHKFDDGLKLMEFGCSSNGTMTALAVLLSDGNGRGGGDLKAASSLIGSWAGDRIVIAGDYADDGNHLTDELVEKWRKYYAEDSEGKTLSELPMPNLYQVAQYLFEDVSDQILTVIFEDGSVAQRHNRVAAAE